MKPLYIISSSCISPQITFDTDSFLANEHIISNNDNVLYCTEPDFRQFINPVQIRRMSRALKIGFSAAIDCLGKTGNDVEEIGAVIVGTGKGCLVDTEEFIHSIRRYNETALNPTHFIHSTYNQLNGMIALNKKINSYNITYAHRGFSFEHTIIDASLLVDEGTASHILAGSFDEMTTEHFDVKKMWGYWKDEKTESRDLLLSSSTGTIAGEGSSFYCLSNKKTADRQVAVKGIKTLYSPTQQDIILGIQSILRENNLTENDIDIVLRGNNGNINQEHHDVLFTTLFPDSAMLYFKHLCGEYDTAVQFGFWIGIQILIKQFIPDILYHPSDLKPVSKKPVRHILLYNNYFELNQSLILLSI